MHAGQSVKIPLLSVSTFNFHSPQCLNKIFNIFLEEKINFQNRSQKFKVPFCKTNYSEFSYCHWIWNTILETISIHVIVQGSKSIHKDFQVFKMKEIFSWTILKFQISSGNFHMSNIKFMWRRKRPVVYKPSPTDEMNWNLVLVT